MCCARNNARRKAFTLLEVMIAVAVLALIAGSIYRFVVGDLTSIKVSTDDTAQKQAIQALVAVLQEELCNLPLGQQNAFLGEAHKFSDKSSDQIEWLSEAGNGLFTEAATGTWKVTLLLRPQEKSNTNVLGILRQLPDNSSKENHWLPLLPNVDAMEVRYYDQRLNAWLDKWSDSATRPSLVRFRIWRTDQTIPYETIIELPPTRLPT
jgi:prepilin-type N-terminal cleavage/methylation domain-containing protein